MKGEMFEEITAEEIKAKEEGILVIANTMVPRIVYGDAHIVPMSGRSLSDARSIAIIPLSGKILIKLSDRDQLAPPFFLLYRKGILKKHKWTLISSPSFENTLKPQETNKKPPKT